MRSLGYLLVVFVGTIIATITAQDPIPPNIIVTAGDLGKIQGGLVNTTKTQRPFYAFHGIPYARPESYIGANRFQPPTLWEGALPDDGNETFIANKILKWCPQNAIFSAVQTESETQMKDLSQNLTYVLIGVHKADRNIRNIFATSQSSEEAMSRMPKAMGDEECLILNINSPKIPVTGNEPLMPVIVFIHGGGSDGVWGSAFTGLRLMEKDVVLVTINYRLGVLGALNLEMDGAPGSGVLYDTITSLKWMQKYIRYFGGDPNKITLSGQSAGAMISTHLLTSPLAQGLFHRVWGFSGAALNVWATAQSPSLPYHLIIANHAGCLDDPNAPIDEAGLATAIACMKLATVDRLVFALNQFKYDEERQGYLGYDARMPSVQHPRITHPKVLPERPLDLLKKMEHDPVPLVLGATRHDGSYPLKGIYENWLVPNKLDEDPDFLRNRMIPTLMKNMGVPDESGALYHSLMHMFLGNASNTGDFDSKIPGLIDLTTTLAFKAGEYKTLEWHSKIQPKSYFYNFDYKGLWTLYNFLWGMFPKVPGGICHTDDLFYVYFLFPLFPNDLAFSDRMVDYYVNFATHGDPNGPAGSPQIWPVYDPIRHPCLKLDKVDQTEYNCQDTWIGNSYELFPEEEDWKMKN